MFPGTALEERAMRLGIPELILILAIILLLFGTSRLAGLGKGLGQAIRGFKSEVDPKDQDKQ
jgi:sec-independent protein translocase protein TatA